MATVKLKFRPSTVADRPGTIVYFITHRRIVRQITTGYKITHMNGMKNVMILSCFLKFLRIV